MLCFSHRDPSVRRASPGHPSHDVHRHPSLDSIHRRNIRDSHRSRDSLQIRHNRRSSPRHHNMALSANTSPMQHKPLLLAVASDLELRRLWSGYRTEELQGTSRRQAIHRGCDHRSVAIFHVVHLVEVAIRAMDRGNKMRRVRSERPTWSCRRI